MKHTQVEIPNTVESILSEMKSDKDGVAYIAVSNDFYDVDDQEKYEDVYSEYWERYQSIINMLNVHYQEKASVFNYDDSEYPDWAVGESIAVWDKAKVWLSINHEDREVPIIISLNPVE